jgi:flagellar biosynthesis/type III secretory pathway M-ring protein FliF/YscJ
VSALLLGETPALPLDEAGKYVAGAYVVFMVLLVVYVAIMAIKLQRIERELRDLASFAEQRNNNDEDTSEGASNSGDSHPSEVAAVSFQGGANPPAADAERSTRGEFHA